MRRTRFDTWPCSIARTVDIAGDWWTPLVMREAFYGARRFEEFQQRLGLSRNVLAQRLDRLVGEDMLKRVRYQQHPARHEYRLTEKGRDFFAVLAAMIRWGDRWLADPGGPPVQLRDRQTGRPVDVEVVDARTAGRSTSVRSSRCRARVCRRLLRAYPPRYRFAREDELISTLLEAAEPDWEVPSLRDCWDIVRGGLLTAGANTPAMGLAALSAVWTAPSQPLARLVRDEVRGRGFMPRYFLPTQIILLSAAAFFTAIGPEGGGRHTARSRVGPTRWSP